MCIRDSVAVERIRRSGTHMQVLIDDLLDLTRIETQRFGVNVQSVESRVMLDEALLAASPLAEAKRITLAGELIDSCLLYTSDAADERSSVDLGGRRII